MKPLRKRSHRLFAALALAAGLLVSPAVALADWDQQNTVCVYYTETAGACWVTWVNESGGRIDRWFGFWGNDYMLLAEYSY